MTSHTDKGDKRQKSEHGLADALNNLALIRRLIEGGVRPRAVFTSPASLRNALLHYRRNMQFG